MNDAEQQTSVETTTADEQKSDAIKLVEQHVIRADSKYFQLLSDFTIKSRNLYNQSNYIQRQLFFQHKPIKSYVDLDKIAKFNTEYPDYRRMPTAQTAQQTLRVLSSNWKGYFKAHKDWKKNPEKYLGEPRPPKYRKGKKGFALTVTNQDCSIKKDGLIHFPASFQGYTIKPRFPKEAKLQQVRFIPTKHNYITVEIVYKLADEKPALISGHRYLGVDLGINNLAAVGNNFGERPFVISGKGLKSINHDFNRRLKHFQSIADGTNASIIGKKQQELRANENPSRIYRRKKLKRMKAKGIYPAKAENLVQDKLQNVKSERISNMYARRNFKIKDFLHKASRILVDYAKKHGVSTIIIGRNKDWKQNTSERMYHTVSFHFAKIPHYKFIQMVEYKAMLAGIKVVKVDESYTSGTSFLDNEKPTKKFYDKSRRKKRGLFVSNKGLKINADVNGAMQIIRKYAKDESLETISKEYPDFERQVRITETKNIRRPARTHSHKEPTKTNKKHRYNSRERAKAIAKNAPNSRKQHGELVNGAVFPVVAVA